MVRETRGGGTCEALGVAVARVGVLVRYCESSTKCNSSDCDKVLSDHTMDPLT